jgi:DNA (cytosine-5)-methyltransferase 1
MTLTFGSLFAGVGGFDMGFEQAGFECKFQVEWDKNCRSVLDRHWPDVEKWGDISNVNGRFLPPVDCIIFGSPCQDLSVAGKRAGLEGERSGLFHEAVRIIKEMRDATNGTFPRWTVWSSNNGRDFGTVVNEMAEAGAVVQEYAVLDAQYFSVPQRRVRVFLVSCFDPATAERCPDPLLPVTESVRGDTKKGKQKRQSAARTLTEGVGGDGAIVNAIGASIYHKSTVVNQDVNCGHLVTEGAILGSDVVGSLNTSDAKMISNQYVNENKCVVEPYVKSRRAQSADDDETWIEGKVNPTLNSFDVGDTRTTTAVLEPVLFENSYRDGARIAKDGVTQTLTSKMGTGGGNTPMIATAYSIREDAKANTFSATELDHANALSALRPSPQSHHAQMFIAQPMAVRRLTPIECEKLQGWPVDHTRWKADGTEMADTHRYRMIGNGVASPVAKWVAEQIAKVEHAKG